MAKYKVEISGIDTSKLKVIKNKEMIELFKELKQGNLEAKNILIEGNLRLVLSLIQKFTNRNENLDDLFQIGCIGLIKAINNFDIDLDIKFSTYAVPLILGEIKRYLRDNNSIRISRHLKDVAYKVLIEKERLVNLNECDPSIEQLEKATGFSKYDIIMSLEACQQVLSLNEPVNGDLDSISLEDQIKDPNDQIDSLTSFMMINKGIKDLNMKEKEIINRRYFEGQTQFEIAQELCISQAQVSRLEKMALLHLRHYFE